MYKKGVVKIEIVNESIDMISLNCSLDEKYFDRLQRVVDDVGCTMWESKKVSEYRYNAVLKVENNDSSIYFGWYHNSKPRHDGIDLKIEYNPNKIVNYDAIKILLKLSKMVYIRSFDYAIDVDEPLCNVVFAEARKQVNVYKGTYYIGARNNGVKIYDKAEEQKRDDIVLTRVEYRCPVKIQVYPWLSVDLFGIFYPDIEFLNVDLTTDVETVLLLEGLRARPELYKRLTRRKKDKIKKMSESLPRINFQEHLQEIKHQLEQHVQLLFV